MTALRTVAVFNRKGGSGKTTISVNLAACLAERGLRTLVIDTDEQCNASMGLNVNLTGVTLADVLRGAASPAARATAWEKLEVLPGSPELPALTGTLDPAVFGQRVRHLLPAYDRVIVDCAPSLLGLAPAVLRVVDAVIVPCDAPDWGRQGVAVTQAAVDDARHHNPKIRILGIVASRFFSREIGMQAMYQHLKATYDGLVCETPIPHSARVRESATIRVPVIWNAPRSAPAAAFRRLTDELEGRW